jgi:hypothetical protein
VNPAKQRVVKILPHNPPREHERILVDGERCRVVSCRVDWDGPNWTIRSLRVEADPAA